MPPWWVSLPGEAERVLRSLPGVEIETIGRSAGGLPILAGSYGSPDPLPGRTSSSLASARAAKDPLAFYGRGHRQRQHLLLVGATHGTEIEGTVAILNVLHAIITGEDLRGRPWPELHALKDRFRIVIVPFLNMDGRMRYPDVHHFLDGDPAFTARVTFGELKDGGTQEWLAVKRFAPQPLDRVRKIGSYFNDAGVNLVYDDFFGEPQPETRALMKLCRREMPDMVLLSHTNRGTLVEPAVSFIPRHFQHRLVQLSGAVAQACAKRGLTRHIVARPEPYCGQVFYQTDALHHHCGALPVLMEFPAGTAGASLIDSLDAILELGATALQEVLTFGDTFGFRPPE